MKTLRSIATASLTIGALASGAVFAENQMEKDQLGEPTSAPVTEDQKQQRKDDKAAARDMQKARAEQATRDTDRGSQYREQVNGTFISLSGTVGEVQQDQFKLDVGTGTVTVSMENWQQQTDDMNLEQGDEVTVFGLTQKDFFENRTIEAESIYVANLSAAVSREGSGQQRPGEAMDEMAEAQQRGKPAETGTGRETAATRGQTQPQDTVWYTYYYVGPLDYDLELTGRVTAIEGREFTIDTGEREIRVNTAQLEYNPMDDEGFQKISEGDVVRVAGNLDESLFENREIMAASVISLN